VDVIFDVIWATIVHHQFDMADVQASGTQTCGYHDVSDVIFEILNETLSIDLVLASVEHDSLISNFVQFLE